MEITYNRDPKYWETKRTNCNCMAFALNAIGWLVPYEDDDERFYGALDLLYEGVSVEDVMETFLEQDLDYLLSNFPELVQVDYETAMAAPSSTRVIAYRVGLVYDDDLPDEMDTDFHFKVRIDGRWRDKMGTGPVEDCALISDEPWEGIDGLEYASRILYFIVKS